MDKDSKQPSTGRIAWGVGIAVTLVTLLMTDWGYLTAGPVHTVSSIAAAVFFGFLAAQSAIFGIEFREKRRREKD
ncbi:hypothetical protein JMM63_12610 [Rhodovulum sulfidophilum]|uniref:Inner-membrane translocator n=2 Tax=Rhodovulum TaxID=34008 RepID=A0A0D6AZW3_RHOSU|nr:MULTISPECIES: hypothetical protein [Rhodovulum]ANB35390.1 hypothetical protein A6W98_15710 [Rhodovulum sulfidophilum DSM 1374]ANB39211.1 hypothetical protein A6024_15575 [Rhodovulum sulfidophilum]MBK5925491.1 hypothetical protein [Rhodovulum sulfidophilum]MBL3552307.1 hypothetical protein [Rhodovulum sulfidophilum]MBL3561700.1 hypothetical protein [Rhodovulum sulfidophilum]